jgi:hypothetical protein
MVWEQQTLLFPQARLTSPGVRLRKAHAYVSLEAEIPEVLYRGMKDFIGDHPSWDQYRVMSSALAHFLFQNGSDNRAVSERYLDDLFMQSDP